MARDLFNLSLADITPESIKHDKIISAVTSSLDPELNSASYDISEAFIISRIDELPELLIDLLAWQWHVDYYEPDLSLEVKRNLVKSSISWHRIKGTPQAVEQLVTQLFGNAKVSEWFDYSGRAYFFRVAVNIGGDNIIEADKSALIKLRRVIKCAQNARSWLEFISLIYDLEDTQFTREELSILKLVKGYYDYYPYRLNCNARRWLDYAKLDGSFVFHEAKVNYIQGLSKNIKLDGKYKLDGLQGDNLKCLDGKYKFGWLYPEGTAILGGCQDLINIDSLNLVMRVNAFTEDYSREAVKLMLDGKFKLDGQIKFLAGKYLDGKHKFNKFNGKHDDNLFYINLPQDKEFLFGIKSVLTECADISELNNIKLKSLLEDFYNINTPDLMRLNGKYKFHAGEYLNGEYKFDGVRDRPLSFAGIRPVNEQININIKNIFSDDYSIEAVTPSLRSGKYLDGKYKFDGAKDLNELVLNGEVNLLGADMLDGKYKFDRKRNRKIYITRPSDRFLNLNLNACYEEAHDADDLDLDLSLKLSYRFNGNLRLDGAVKAGGEVLPADNLSVTRFSLNGKFKFDGAAKAIHDAKPFIAA